MAQVNAEMVRKGDILTITIDLAQTHGRSKKGTTTKIGTTGGFAAVPGPDGTGEDEKIILNLNCNKMD